MLQKFILPFAGGSGGIRRRGGYKARQGKALHLKSKNIREIESYLKDHLTLKFGGEKDFWKIS